VEALDRNSSRGIVMYSETGLEKYSHVRGGSPAVGLKIKTGVIESNKGEINTQG